MLMHRFLSYHVEKFLSLISYTELDLVKFLCKPGVGIERLTLDYADKV